MKVTVVSSAVLCDMPLADMEENGLSVGIVTEAPNWAASSIGVPVFHARNDTYYFPHDDTFVDDIDAVKYRVRPLADHERIIIEN